MSGIETQMWTDVFFSLLLVFGGMLSGALLMWSWLSWPVTTRRDARERAAAMRRHPAGKHR